MTELAKRGTLGPKLFRADIDTPRRVYPIPASRLAFSLCMAYIYSGLQFNQTSARIVVLIGLPNLTATMLYI